MKITFLGTGTSHGIPVIGCDCSVCKSEDDKDKRYRSSILIEKGKTKIVIDTGYEFRLQCLRANIKRLDAVLYTHSHADHVASLDELRVFSSDNIFPIYSGQSTLNHLIQEFPYAFDTKPFKKGIPQLSANVLEPYKTYKIKDINVTPIPIRHACRTIFAYRFGKFAYVTDVSEIFEESFMALKGVEVLVIDALRKRKHPSHFSFEEAKNAAIKIGAKDVYFTHISHETSYSEINSLFKENIHSSYDGLELEIGE